jgi:hypothetical protein
MVMLFTRFLNVFIQLCAAQYDLVTYSYKIRHAWLHFSVRPCSRPGKMGLLSPRQEEHSRGAAKSLDTGLSASAHISVIGECHFSASPSTLRRS